MAKKDGHTLLDSFINENIKTLRTHHKMSQADIFQRLGISRQQYSNIESGYAAPSLRHLIKLTEIFDVSLDDLCLSELSQIDNINFKTKSTEKVINSNDTLIDNIIDTKRKVQKKLSIEPPTAITVDTSDFNTDIEASPSDGIKFVENAFSEYTDEQIHEMIAEQLKEFLLEMYEEGRAYPGSVVDNMIEAYRKELMGAQQEIGRLTEQLRMAQSPKQHRQSDTVPLKENAK